MLSPESEFPKEKSIIKEQGEANREYLKEKYEKWLRLREEQILKYTKTAANNLGKYPDLNSLEDAKKIIENLGLTPPILKGAPWTLADFLVPSGFRDLQQFLQFRVINPLLEIYMPFINMSFFYYDYMAKFIPDGVIEKTEFIRSLKQLLSDDKLVNMVVEELEKRYLIINENKTYEVNYSFEQLEDSEKFILSIDKEIKDKIFNLIKKIFNDAYKPLFDNNDFRKLLSDFFVDKKISKLELINIVGEKNIEKILEELKNQKFIIIEKDGIILTEKFKVLRNEFPLKLSTEFIHFRTELYTFLKTRIAFPHYDGEEYLNQLTASPRKLLNKMQRIKDSIKYLEELENREPEWYPENKIIQSHPHYLLRDFTVSETYKEGKENYWFIRKHMFNKIGLSDNFDFIFSKLLEKNYIDKDGKVNSSFDRFDQEFKSLFNYDEITFNSIEEILRRTKNPENFAPVLIIPPDSGHTSQIAGFGKGKSIAEDFSELGRATYSVDWLGATTENPQTVSDMVSNVVDCIEKIAGKNGKVRLIGLCQGGPVAAMVAALYPEKVEVLYEAGAPLNNAIGDNGVTKVIKEPMEFFNWLFHGFGDKNVYSGKNQMAGFLGMDFYAKVVQYFWNLVDNINNKSFLEKFEPFHIWYGTIIDLSIWQLEWVENLFKGNKLQKGEFQILKKGDDKYTTVNPKNITCPVILMEGTKDDITPPNATWTFGDVLGTDPKYILKMRWDVGHIGLYMGGESKQPWIEAILKSDKMVAEINDSLNSITRNSTLKQAA